MVNDGDKVAAFLADDNDDYDSLLTMAPPPDDGDKAAAFLADDDDDYDSLLTMVPPLNPNQ